MNERAPQPHSATTQKSPHAANSYLPHRGANLTNKSPQAANSYVPHRGGPGARPPGNMASKPRFTLPVNTTRPLASG
ncbi:hypothetical protein GCM10023192_52120 [Amycolatopsis samaneae]